MCNSYFTVFYWLYRDYHIAFFISDPLSASGPDISAPGPDISVIGLISGPWAVERSDMQKGHVKIFLSYAWHKKTFSEIDELQYDTNYGKGYDIFRNRVIYFLYQPAKVVSGRCIMHFIRF